MGVNSLINKIIDFNKDLDEHIKYNSENLPYLPDEDFSLIMKDIIDLQSEYDKASNLYSQVEIEFGNWANEESIKLEKVYQKKDIIIETQRNLLEQQSYLNSRVMNYQIRQKELENAVDQAKRDYERIKDKERQLNIFWWALGYNIYLATELKQSYDNYNSKQQQRNDNYQELDNITNKLLNTQNELNKINNRLIELNNQLIPMEKNMDVINSQMNFFNGCVSIFQGISLKLNDIKNDLSNNQLDNIPEIIKNVNIVLDQTKQQHEKDQKQSESLRSKLKGNYEYRITAILNRLN